MLTACLLLGLLGASPAPAAPQDSASQDPASQDPASQDRGACRAIGVVLDTEGQPICGARIKATAKLRILPDSFDPELVTDADGRYEFRFTPTGDSFLIQLDFGGAGLSTVTRKLTTAPTEPGAALELEVVTLTRGLPLELRLVDESGQPLCAGWKVELALGAGTPVIARRDCSALQFCFDCVPHGSFTARVSRSGEPGPTFETTVEQRGKGEVQTIRVVSRRQIWVRVELPFPEGAPVPGALLRGLSVLAVTTEGERTEAIYDSTSGLYVLDGLPAGPLDLQIVGPDVLRRFEGELPERGLVPARMSGAFDLKIVLLEQGSGGRIGRFEVNTNVPGVKVHDVPGDVSKLVEGLVRGVGTLELSVAGSKRPHVTVDLAELTAEELAAGCVVRTLPNWTALRGRLIDEIGDAGGTVSVEILSIDGDGDERPAGERRELDRGGNYLFASLVPGPHVVRVRWANRHWQDYPVQVGEQGPDFDVRRERPAILDLAFEGSWPDELGLVVHPCGAPTGCGALTTLRPRVEGRFGPFELAPGEVDLAVAFNGSMRTWPLERLTVAPGPRSHRIDVSTLPALVRWRVQVDGASVVAACRGEVRPICPTSGAVDAVRLGTTGARKDAMLVEAVDSKLILTSEDETWGKRVDLIGLRPGEVRDLPVGVSRVRRRVRFLVDGKPLRNNEIHAEVRTPGGVLLRQDRRTDADGEMELMFVPGVLTVFGVGIGCDAVDRDWSESLEQGTLVIEFR